MPQPSRCPSPNGHGGGLRHVAVMLAFVGLLFSALGWAQENAAARLSCNLPAADAERSLKQFSVWSGLEVLFVSESVANVRTNAVKGDYTPREAIDRMLAGTKLAAVQDEKTRAIRIISAARGPRRAGEPAPSLSSDKKKTKP